MKCIWTRSGSTGITVYASKGTYAGDSAEKEHSHKCHETTFKPLLAVLKGKAEVDNIPEEVRLS